MSSRKNIWGCLVEKPNNKPCSSAASTWSNVFENLHEHCACLLAYMQAILYMTGQVRSLRRWTAWAFGKSELTSAPCAQMHFKLCKIGFLRRSNVHR